MRRSLAMLIAAGACLLPQTASACIRLHANIYDGRSPTHEDVLARSATVDWVDIAPRPTYRCASDAPTSFACVEGVGPSKDPHVAVVRERLKGQSPARYVLYTPDRDGSGDGLLHRRLLADMRSGEVPDRFNFALNQKEEAEDRHRSVLYWDWGVLDLAWINGGPTSCGWDKHPSVDPRLPYLVFRDSMGGVIALVPVLHDDDELLQRLRRYVHDPKSFGRAEMPLAAFLRSAETAVVGEVLSCERSMEFGRAKVRVLEGSLTSEEDPPAKSADGAQYWLTAVENHFDARKQRCPVGARIFVLKQKFVLTSSDREVAWARAAIPDATARELKELAIPVAGAQLWDPMDYRVTTVGDGRLDGAGFITGLTLTSASALSTDEALRLVAEEPAAALKEIRLTPYKPASPSSIPAAYEYWLPVGMRPVEALVALGLIAALGLGMGVARRRWSPRS